MEKEARLVRKYNKKRKRTEWALVSRTNPNKVLKWFGPRKPSKERVLKEERRVQWFKHRGSAKEAWLTEELPVTPSQDTHPSLKEDIELVKKILYGPKSNIERKDVFGPQVETEFGSGLLKKDKELYPRYEFTETPQFRKNAKDPTDETKPVLPEMQKMIEETETLEKIGEGLRTKIQDIISDIEKIRSILNFEIKGRSFCDFLRILYVANSDLWDFSSEPSLLVNLISEEPDSQTIERLKKTLFDLKMLSNTIEASRERYLLVAYKNVILELITFLNEYIDLADKRQITSEKVKQIKDKVQKIMNLLSSNNVLGSLSLDFWTIRESFRRSLLSNKEWIENLSNLSKYREELINKVKDFTENFTSFNESSLKVFLSYFEEGIKKVREKIEELEEKTRTEVRPFVEPGLFPSYYERSVSPSSIYKPAPEETYGLLTEIYRRVLEMEEVPSSLNYLKEFLDFLTGSYNKVKSVSESLGELVLVLNEIPFILKSSVIDELSRFGARLLEDTKIEEIDIPSKMIEETKVLSKKLGQFKGALKNRVSFLEDLIDFAKTLKGAFERGPFSKLASIEKFSDSEIEKLRKSLEEYFFSALEGVLFFIRKSLKQLDKEKEPVPNIDDIKTPSGAYDFLNYLLFEIRSTGLALKEIFEIYIPRAEKAITPILETIADKIVSFLEEKLDFEGIVLSVIPSYEERFKKIPYSLLKSALSELGGLTQKFIHENRDLLETSFSLLIDRLPLKYLREFIPESDLKDLFIRAANELSIPGEVIEKCLTEISLVPFEDHLTYKEIESIWINMLSNLKRKGCIDNVTLEELRKFLLSLHKNILQSYMDNALYTYLEEFLRSLPSEGYISFKEIQDILSRVVEKMIPSEIYDIEEISSSLQRIIEEYLQEMVQKGIKIVTDRSLAEAIDYQSLINEVKKYVKEQLLLFVNKYLQFVTSKKQKLLEHFARIYQVLKEIKEKDITVENLGNVKESLKNIYREMESYKSYVKYIFDLSKVTGHESFLNNFIENVPEVVREKTKSFYEKYVHQEK